MLKAILTFHYEALAALENGKALKDLIGLPIKEKIGKAKMVEEKNLATLEKLPQEIKSEINK
jgi:V/A-type H+-transporting ATPase subunit A